jgi:Trypsin-like peptidase domain
VAMADIETECRAIVRIFQEDGDCVVGMGFWVSPGLLVTCAHVVNQALGLEDTAAEMPTREVKLDFPFLNSVRLRAKVTHWSPVDEALGKRDIAGLSLLDALPQYTAPIPLAKSTGDSFVTRGCPKDYDSFPLGAAVTISPAGATTNGWIQLENPGGRVKPGFSGGLVWEKSSETAVGMIVFTDADKSLAFMIPARYPFTGFNRRDWLS